LKSGAHKKQREAGELWTIILILSGTAFGYVFKLFNTNLGVESSNEFD